MKKEVKEVINELYENYNMGFYTPRDLARTLIETLEDADENVSKETREKFDKLEEKMHDIFNAIVKQFEDEYFEICDELTA